MQHHINLLPKPLGSGMAPSHQGGGFVMVHHWLPHLYLLLFKRINIQGRYDKIVLPPFWNGVNTKRKKSPSKGSTFFPFWVDPFSEQVQGSYRQGQVKCKDFSRTNLIVIYLALSFIGSTSSENLCFEKLNNNNNVTMNSLKIKSLFLPWQRNLGMSKTSCFLVSYAPLPLPVTAMHFHPFVQHPCLYYMVDSAPYVYCTVPLPKDIVLANLCYKHTFPLGRYKFRIKKKKKKKEHTH